MPGKNKMVRILLALSVVLIPCLIWAPVARAHKVYLFAWTDREMVHTESYFSGGKKVKGGLISVFDPSGNKLLEGRTNEKGEFSFKIPQENDLKIVLEAGVGHRAECLLRVDEERQKGGRTEPTVSKLPGPSHTTPQADVEEIRKVVEEALDERLKPLARALAKIQEEKGPGLTEIIGGVGYIFGVMGLILYFRSRRKT